eukprot:scaffold5072_cov19-Tisochrysis_lutea.AAC.2
MKWALPCVRGASHRIDFWPLHDPCVICVSWCVPVTYLLLALWLLKLKCHPQRCSNTVFGCVMQMAQHSNFHCQKLKPRLVAPPESQALWHTLTQCCLVSAHGMATAEALAVRVGRHGGAALIIDYGRDAPYGDSLMAIRDHKGVEVSLGCVKYLKDGGWSAGMQMKSEAARCAVLTVALAVGHGCDYGGRTWKKNDVGSCKLCDVDCGMNGPLWILFDGHQSSIMRVNVREEGAMGAARDEAAES